MAAYKTVSDLDTNGLGQFGIEWEYEHGGRMWEWFDTEDERTDALASFHESYPEDDNLTDAEADAMTLASAGMGTDEDYNGGCYDDGY